MLVDVYKIIVFRGKEAEYSDEEESDTEEYKENRHKVKEFLILVLFFQLCFRSTL